MSKKKIALIGSGQIGGTLALLFMQKNIEEIVLFDVFLGTAVGKALDLSQMASLFGSTSKIKGTDRYEDIKDADVCIVTAGFPRKPGMSREDLLEKNLAVIKEVALGIKTFAKDSFVIMVTNPLDVMVYAFLKLSSFKPNKVVGMAGVLDSARFRAFLAEELNVAKEDIHSMVLGGHGDDMVPLPRFSTVSGISLSELLDLGLLKKDKLDAIIERTRLGGGEIVKHLGVGSAFYAPAISAMQMALSYLCDQKRLFPCASFLNGEYGIKDLFVGVPTIIGKNGVEKIIELKLNSDEMSMFQKSKLSVEKVISELKKLL